MANAAPKLESLRRAHETQNCFHWPLAWINCAQAEVEDSSMQRFENAREAALALRPDDPVYCFRPQVLKADARQFMGMFPGKTAYAVKTNGEQIVLKTLVGAGVTAFDVASPGEFSAVRAVSPDAEMLYMHPVKAQSDIKLALEKYAIRVISLDHEDEITKLTRVVRALDIDPGAISVFVRIQTKGSAE